MNYNGDQIIKAIVRRLKDKAIPPHDSAILHELRKLDECELAQLLTFGDIA